MMRMWSVFCFFLVCRKNRQNCWNCLRNKIECLLCSLSCFMLHFKELLYVWSSRQVKHCQVLSSGASARQHTWSTPARWAGRGQPVGLHWDEDLSVVRWHANPARKRPEVMWSCLQSNSARSFYEKWGNKLKSGWKEQF